MEGIKIVVFVIVGVIWLAIWIVGMFKKAFNQPNSRKPEPYIPISDQTIAEVLRQQMEKQKKQGKDKLERKEKDLLEPTEPGPMQKMKVEKLQKRSLESDKPKYRSLENLEPRRRSLEITEVESGQRDDIVRRRREKNIYQASDKKEVSIFAQMLQNPDGARKAIVLAEILKPKF